jgi:hypothetical protein
MVNGIFVIALIAPLGAPPTIAFVEDTGPLRDEDEGWNLLTPGLCSDILGHAFPVEGLPLGGKDWSIQSLYHLIRGRPYIVSLFVDMNRLSPADVEKTMNQIRSGWKTTMKVLFVFRLARCIDVIH